MKKSLKIAALGLAAFGAVAGVAAPAMAEGDPTATLSHVDTINLTVDSTCTLGTLTGGAYTGTDATTHDHGTYNNPKTSTAETLGAWTGDTLALTMQPGTKSENIGTTTFIVRCNNAAGYDLKAQASGANLVKSGSSAVIPGGAVSDTDSFWGFKIAAEAGGMTEVETYKTIGAVPTDETKIAGKVAAGNINAGEKATVTYAAGVSQSQESGLYSATVTYTLTQL